MKKTLLLFILFIFKDTCFSQPNIWGQYRIASCYSHIDWLEIRPSGVYKDNSTWRCENGYSSDTGIYKIVDNTIKIYTFCDTIEKLSFLIGHSPEISISNDQNNFDKTIFPEDNELASLIKCNADYKSKDKIDSNHAIGCKWLKYISYFENGDTEFVRQDFGKDKFIITRYYNNKKVKQVENYCENVKHGVWTYYTDDGKMVREEYYRKGKIIKAKSFSLNI